MIKKIIVGNAMILFTIISLSWLLKTIGFTGRIIRRLDNEKTKGLGNT